MTSLEQLGLARDQLVNKEKLWICLDPSKAEREEGRNRKN